MPPPPPSFFPALLSAVAKGRGQSNKELAVAAFEEDHHVGSVLVRVSNVSFKWNVLKISERCRDFCES